jgi:hypothetical protein
VTIIPQKVVVHHSASHDGPGNNTKEIRAYHKSLGWADCGYHALSEEVNGEYEILMGRPWTMAGAHTLGQNHFALGLCLVGNFNLAEPPAGQILIAARLVAMWCAIYRIPVDLIYEHRHFNDTDCPGRYFDLAKFKQAVMLA